MMCIKLFVDNQLSILWGTREAFNNGTHELEVARWGLGVHFPNKGDPTNGHIINNPEAEKMWSREYEPGWEPKI